MCVRARAFGFPHASVRRNITDCGNSLAASWATSRANVAKIGGGSMLTEFGAVGVHESSIEVCGGALHRVVACTGLSDAVDFRRRSGYCATTLTRRWNHGLCPHGRSSSLSLLGSHALVWQDLLDVQVVPGHHDAGALEWSFNVRQALPARARAPERCHRVVVQCRREHSGEHDVVWFLILCSCCKHMSSASP